MVTYVKLDTAATSPLLNASTGTWKNTTIVVDRNDSATTAVVPSLALTIGLVVGGIAIGAIIVFAAVYSRNKRKLLSSAGNESQQNDHSGTMVQTMEASETSNGEEEQ